MPLVARQVVHDRDVVWTELRDRNLFDVGCESIAVVRAIEHSGRNDPSCGETCDESRWFPLAIRNNGPPMLAAWTAAVTTRNVGRSQIFIDDDKAAGIKRGFAFNPILPTRHDLRPFLLAVVRRPIVLRGSLCRPNKGWMLPSPNAKPFAANRRRNSFDRKIRTAFSRARIVSFLRSIWPDLWSAPSALGRVSPCYRSRKSAAPRWPARSKRHPCGCARWFSRHSADDWRPCAPERSCACGCRSCADARRSARSCGKYRRCRR